LLPSTPPWPCTCTPTWHSGVATSGCSRNEHRECTVRTWFRDRRPKLRKFNLYINITTIRVYYHLNQMLNPGSGDPLSSMGLFQGLFCRGFPNHFCLLKAYRVKKKVEKHLSKLKHTW
jgi:hypothetical protein